MKRRFLLLGALMSGAIPAVAVDHDNIDANRPLDFDDAETIAFREKSSEVGAALAQPRGGKLGIAGDAEFLYGFAKNWHLNLGLNPALLDRNGSGRRFDVGDFAIGVQHNFNRETQSSPAFGFRADAYLPTSRDSSGVDFRLRGIASRKFGRYGRLHLNADLNVNTSPGAGEQRMLPDVILGYSQPLGYPRRFDRTLVAQVGLRAAPTNDNSAIVNIGVGLRQQVSQRSVFDLGIKSDISGAGNDRERFRVVAGYSTAF
ncbi:hypothetical protein IAD21_01601 [Abditibacteriota bacterium]|nr:hypothetical protein IAD21_01601 [Abditibacteriota bacterium]